MERIENSATSLKTSHGNTTSSDPNTSKHVLSTSTTSGPNTSKYVLSTSTTSGPNTSKYVLSTSTTSAFIRSESDILSPSTSKFIDVCFHAIISPKMLKNPNKDEVNVAVKSRHGVYKFHKLALEKQRLPDGYYVASGTVKLPESLCGITFRLSYTYCVIHGDPQSERTWEYFSSGYINEVESWRKLSVPTKYMNTGIYHRYDGIVRESRRLGEGNVLYSVKKFFGIDGFHKLLLNDAEMSMKAFQPVWQLTSMEADGINGEELVTHMSLIVEGMTTAGLWHESGAGIHKPFAIALLPYMKRQIQYLERTKSAEKLNEEAKILHLITAVTVTHLVNEYEVELDQRDKRLLCEALLPMPDFEKKISPDIDHLKKYLPTIYKNVAESVLKFSRGIAGKTSDPIWLFSVPIVHFMLGKCTPFEDVPQKVDEDATVPKWWGVVEYKNDIACFKDKLKWTRSADEVVKRLAPYFEVDYLLPRTLLASLRLNLMYNIVIVNDIPTDIILAASCYNLKKKPNDVVLVKMLQHVSQNCLKESSDADVSISSMFSVWRSCRIAGDLLGECLNQKDANKIIRLSAVEVYLLALHSFHEMQKMVDQMHVEDHRGMFRDFLARIVHWLLSETYNMLEHMKLWNAALSIRLPEGYTQLAYIKHLKDSLLKSLQEMAVYDELVQIYCVHSECFEGVVQDILSDVALKAVNNCTNINWSKGDKISMRLGALLSNVMEDSWNIEEFNDPHGVLSHVLNWRSFPIYIEMLRNNPRALSDYCKHLLESSVETIQPFIENILDGSILIEDLVKISNKRESFLKMIVAMKCKETRNIMRTLAIREKEFEAFERNYQMVQEFTYVCKQCKADTSVLETQLRMHNSIDRVCLNQLVRTVSLKDLKRTIEFYQPTVTVFELCPEEFEILPRILTCSKSSFFMKIWEKTGTDLEEQNGEQIDVKEVFDKVWKPTFEQWTNLTKKLREGNMLFSEFEEWFESNSEMELRQEFSVLARDGNTEWINKRMFEIKKYGDLKNCVSGAETIMKVVKAFELEGDFSQIQDIITLAECARTRMKKVDASLLKISSILGEISEERAKCLEDFIKCKSLVDWLKESMPAGLKELKVFVDLASIASGEGDMEIEKVNCLHSATTGYAPLIFNMEKTCNAQIFLEKCQEVWKELASNPQLPQMLVDTARQLEWLKSVKKDHGSIEVSSIDKAEAINGKGIYHVGNVNEATLLKNPVLSDVLELRVTDRRLSTKNQFYKYEQLHDLQSRLMLVAGKAEKGNDDVDRFMLILDSVVRLGNIYTKLVTDGCVLFLHWHVKFLCDKTEKTCAVIHFGHGENLHTLKGRTDETNKDVSDIIPKTAKFLEQCHDKWLDFIDDKREKYYSLNFFTIDQMVILQQELVKIGSGQEPSALIYPLLSAVKQGCTKEDLVRAMSAANYDVEQLDMDRQQEMEKNDSEEDMIVEKESDDLKNEELNDTECTGNQKSLASNIERALEEQKEYGTGEMDIESLIKALGELWTAFLTSISLSMSDYLSVEHLGMILKRLTEQDTFKVERTFLSCFEAGEPNLIICPQSEIYNTVLTVYSHEDDKPLPQSDEVLLCTPHTTLDMIEIFWRRVLFADNDKVHCLVNADLLDYDVSDKGEKSLERHMQNTENKGRLYKLVVICSSENEYKSRIVAALDKYHRPQFNIDVANIRKYLLAKFKIKINKRGKKPASALDFEKCSVRVVKSWRAGVGKTLFKKRMVDKLPNASRTKPSDVTIPLYENKINVDNIMDIFKEETLPPQSHKPRLFHIDISHEVQEGVDALLFQLLILGCLGHSSGHVWRRSELDYYIIESMPLLARDTNTQAGRLKCLHHCLDILPHVMCRSPQESLDILSNVRKPPDYTDNDRLFDSIEFKSTTFQRPFQYLYRLDTGSSLIGVNPDYPYGDEVQCLSILLKHCGIVNPSWSELHHFVSFLNKQLTDFEKSSFCGTAAIDDLPGFAQFVLRFLIQMSRDFSTRSLVVSEESPIQMLERQVTRIKEEETVDDTEIHLYQMRRTWETSPHPYLFFNPDQHSMTFLGFNIDKTSGNLIDIQTQNVLEHGMIQHDLFDALDKNNVNLSENFDLLPRDKKLQKLCNVMGLDMAHDPDETYELTTDNVKKILAIYMRFRCQIPVIIMGETGCGKTRLIRFMCALQQPAGVTVENMILMKVHGGTKASDIVRTVRRAEEMARKNAEDYPYMDTVLFFDEANTTEAIGVIKEIMCDKSLGGKPIKLHERLKIVAACNPYRKHSEELIKRLEQAGLGYHVHADKTSDKLGRVPMRRLVYRVQPLPQSMLPLVWDFGQLNTEVEEKYIRQMVLRYIKNQHFPASRGLDTTLSNILMISQDFMREQKDECSFVSLRDVERVLQVMSWFYRQSEGGHLLFRRMRDESSNNSDSDSDSDSEETIDDLTKSLVLALGVCYHACLKNREEYREAVAGYFRPPLQLTGGAGQIDKEISKCQSVFLDSVNLAPNIAKNQALKENVFMMIVCIELRLPLFLVGKPGSSKSLAKTIVADAMQGNAAQNELFKNYKQVQMVSFQCSPLSAPEGILGTFRQCAAYQKDKNLDRFVSIVVLDEIGLAEDSPKMPLKALHPLLEDGCPDDEEPEIYKKVAFIGISNWALDPAKMNRGILVQREVPDILELIESAEGICSTNNRVLRDMRPIIEPLAVSYLKVFKEASTEMREFFGLRDFYSLMKMLYAFMASSNKKLTWLQLKHSILRNFGGLENVTPVEIFSRQVSHLVDQNEKQADDPDCTPAGMIQASLTGDNKSESESRYLLLLTENYGALTILQQKIFTMDNAVVLFGSSFPSDQEYTQVCRNINRIKVCMETGSTVILLNLENLYESLYDALNQYYVCFGGERYVDLGLGSHRVKCKVHSNFRLIVVAETQIVYNNFPIPLINRLEKHFLSLKTILAPSQLELADKLQEWAQCFCEVKVPAYMRIMRQKKNSKKIGDAFMGYHDDTCAAIILHVCQQRECNDQNILQLEEEILKDAQFIMLWCAAPAAVVQEDSQEAFITYFKVQQHECLADYLHNKMVDQKQHYIQAQITTNSKLLSTADIDILCRCIHIQRRNVTLLTLQSFDTEQQFCRQIKSCFDQSNTYNMLLIVQCDCGDQNADLIACARYTVQGELQQVRQDRTTDIHVVFLIQLPGIAGGCFTGFQCGLWHSVHIDDIHPSPEEIPSVAEMHGKSVSALLSSTKERPLGINMEVVDEGPRVEEEEEEMETNEEEIDLMDIEIQENHSDKIVEPKRQFHINYLISKCVQPALGNVKDPASDSSRAIDRLKIILNCLQNEVGDTTVLSGIAKHLTSILREKEQSPGSMITNWLSAEASKPENINRAGTFRRFAVHCLESKVIPLLAGIIAFMDTNRNLDILTNNEEWKIDLWLQIFNNPELTQLKYSLIVSPSRQQELQEVAVKSTSMEGKVFSAVMPFSWLIFGQIDDVLRNFMMSAKEDGDSHFDVVMKTTEIFQTLPLGQLLSSIEGTNIHQVLKSYIVDFVHMVHPVQSDAECDLVCETVLIGCKILIRGEYGRLLPSLLGCHMTYILHDARYKNFSHIVHVWPECSQKTIDFQKKESNFYLVTDEEMTLDILALHMLVEHLEPSKEALNKPDTRTKWLRQVCDYRPIIERIFGHFNQDSENKEFYYGKTCQRGIEQARYQWTRAVVVKLFIEHVCTSGKEEMDIRRCMPLWQTLREGADMKDIKSLEKVEKFLKLCHRDIVAKCFGQPAQCVSCENPIEGAPVRLPCDHVICRKCFYDCMTLKEYECPNCREEFPEDLNPDKSAKVGEIKKYHDYRRRCNSFYMEVVSQLCFSDGTPPSNEVVDKLLTYIIDQTKNKKVERIVSKELTIFDDSIGIDRTPVVRSFLLQQLMQTSGHEIENHLLAYFNYAGRLLHTAGDRDHMIELCQLILQCMEDSLHQQHVNRNDEVAIVTKMLREAPSYLTGGTNLLDKIEHISRVRFSLAVVTKYIHRLYCTSQKSMPNPSVRKLFDGAAKLCEESESPWPRRYFVKQLCRCYGIDSYQTVLAKSDATFLRWIRLPELKGNKVKECHDRYIVAGDEYIALRETVVTTTLSENSEKLEQMIQKPDNEWQTRIRLLLALHREITMNIVYGGDPQKFTDKAKAFLSEFVMNCTLIRNKELTNGILNNTVWRLHGNIMPMMDLAQQNISCLLTHFRVLMVEIPGKTTLLTPLQNIALQPQTMVNSFFPTMPQDELSEIKEAILAARRLNPNENPVFYRCPNGHPYIIGNCGRAATVGTCKACGREIGGEGYQLRPGNELDAGNDRTETGHVLGRAAKLGPISAPERKLNRATFSILRLLTHISMYIGANTNSVAVCQSIKPNIEQDDVDTYLLEHIELDLTSIQNVLGKNKDDVLILIHYLLAQIMNRHTMAVIGEIQHPNICGLLDKNSRSKWEEDFAKRYIEPVLQDLQNIIGDTNNRILKDQRLGSDPLLQILYETDKPQETHDLMALQEIPAVWRYRDMISVNHLRQHIGAAKLKLPVLRLFLQEEHHLRAIRFVPSIIRLQKMLIQKYSRKLDRAEATTLTIQDVKLQMRQERRLKEFNHLLEEFTEAWNCVREALETYVCPANESLVTVAKEYCRSDITDESSVSRLLPTHRDAGLCSYVLLFYLLKKQNLFLQNYCGQSKQKEDNLPKVHVKDISSAHLISYHPDRDLLPMVLANCNYSFEVGQGTKVDYNVANLERQLMDRFLFSKSIISEIQEIETITYRSESTNAVVFKSLYDRIKQDRLNPAVQSQICAELRLKSYPDLCESLDKLDIAISFLKSVGSDPESSLHYFMSNTLKMDNPFPSPKAEQASKCKHTMSLWITLALERAKFLAKYDKKAFEGISDNFKKPLTEEQRQAIEEILNKLPVEQIDVLVELIFECIVLKIDVPQNKDDEDYVDMSKISLRDALIGYLDACPYEEELTIEDSLMEAIGQLPSDTKDPLGVLTAHSVEIWNLLYEVFTNKQRQR